MLRKKCVVKILILAILLPSSSCSQNMISHSIDTLSIQEVKSKYINSAELYKKRLYKTNTSEKFDKPTLNQQYYFEDFTSLGLPYYDTILSGIDFDFGKYDRCRQNLNIIKVRDYFDIEFSTLPFIVKDCKDQFCLQAFFIKIDLDTYKKIADNFENVKMLFLFNIKNPQPRTVKRGEELKFCKNTLHVIPTYNLRVFLYNRRTNEIYYSNFYK